MTDKTSDIDPETLKRRCPRLGSEVVFTYCLTGGDDEKPCWKIFDCWWEHFDVEAWLRARLSPAALEDLKTRASSPPKNKLTSILEIAQQAKKKKDT